MGDGIPITDGSARVHSRALSKPISKRSRIGNFAVFERHVGRILDLLPRSGDVVDIQPLVKRLVWYTLFDGDLGQS